MLLSQASHARAVEVGEGEEAAAVTLLPNSNASRMIVIVGFRHCGMSGQGRVWALPMHGIVDVRAQTLMVGYGLHSRMRQKHSIGAGFASSTGYTKAARPDSLNSG